MKLGRAGAGFTVLEPETDFFTNVADCPVFASISATFRRD